MHYTLQPRIFHNSDESSPPTASEVLVLAAVLLADIVIYLNRTQLMAVHDNEANSIDEVEHVFTWGWVGASEEEHEQPWETKHVSTLSTADRLTWESCSQW